MVPIHASSGAPNEWDPARRQAYEAIVERSGDLILTSDWTTARFVDANPAALERLGYSRTELAEMTGGDLSEFPRDEHRRFSQELIEQGQTHASAIPVRCRDGSLLTMDLWVQRFDTDTGSFHVTVLRDAASGPAIRSDSVHDSARIRESEAFYRGVVTCTEDAVVVTDLQTGETIEANPAACSLFGYSTVEWRSVTLAQLFVHAEALADVDRELGEQGRASRAEIPMRGASAQIFVADTRHNAFESDGRSLIVTVVRDVTDRQRQRQRFERAQRLAAVGEVAAGVAHEINNPAAFAMLNCRLIGEKLAEAKTRLNASQMSNAIPALTSAEQALTDTLEGLERVVSVARDLRQFWRVDEKQIVHVDVNDVVLTTLNRLRNEIRHRARLDLVLAEGVPSIAMHGGKLEQVLTNILLNASQSIVEGQAAANELRVHTTAGADSIVISISDTGHGMDPETLQRVFEPFFSTKSDDQGLGLGMSLSAEIVSAHGGHIHATSTPGLGSRFDVHLPFNTGLSPTPPPPVPALPSGKRVLVVDDDPGMVRAYRRILRGRSAVVVDSGRKALALLEQDPEFDVIVCDLMMPDIDGPDVYRALTESAPHLAARMVFCTGGAITPRMRDFVATVENEVLDKPLRPHDLQRLFEVGGG